MAIDDSGNVYVTGSSSNSQHGSDYLTIKYDASGNELWTARYNGEADADDEAAAICADAQGNVYVTGRSLGLATNLDYVTIKYNSFGVQQWVACYTMSANYRDYVRALTVDDSGNVYVAGNSAGDYITAK